MGQDRDGRLDELGDATAASLECALDLFGVVDVLRGQAALRRTITDPALGTQRRAELAETLLSGKIGPEAVGFVRRAVAMDWRNGLVLADAIEREAVRLALRSSDPDRVRREINAVREVISADDELRAAFGRHAATDTARAELVATLIGGHADDATTALVTRASRLGGGIVHGLDGQLELSSQIRGRRLARATVARPLPGDQAERLTQQLSRVFGVQVDVVEHVDPAVLGGVRVQVGDDVIDGTVSARVSQAVRELG